MLSSRHNLFDKWDETSAYIFGFWLADGCICLNRFKIKNKYYTYKIFYISNTDKQIMNSISKLLQYPYTTLNRRKNWSKLYKIKFHSDKLFDFCYNITKTTNKSQHNFLLPKIPRKYFHHFVRGFFDGDGSVFKSSSRISFTSGNKTNHVEQLRDWLCTNLNLSNRKIFYSKRKQYIWKQLIYCKHDSILLRNFMYKDATIFIKRKKDI